MVSFLEKSTRRSTFNTNELTPKRKFQFNPKLQKLLLHRKFLFLLSVLIASTAALNLAQGSIFTLSIDDPSLPIEFLDKLRENQTAFYAKARPDRCGAAIHDMLMAHSFAFYHNVSYKGACFVKKSRRPRKETIRLQETFALNKFIPYACPPDEEKPYMLVEKKLYRKFDASLFTTQWRKYVQSLVKIPKPETSDDRPFRIAVHIRRGDVDPCIYPDRYLPNSHFLRLIDLYSSRRSNPNQPVHVTIFSAGPSFESFDEFSDRNYSVQLNLDIVEAWNHMMTADVVILSRSSFSYVPAILNPNIVVYTPFRHAALEGWDVVGEDFLKRTLQEIKVLKAKACQREKFLRLRKIFWKIMDDINPLVYSR